MPDISTSNYPKLADADAFVRLVRTLDRHPLAAARGLFAPDRPVFIARAPGRLDVMGGIADYCGSLVLELPIREATFAAVQSAPEPVLRIVSLGADETHRSSAVEMPLADLYRGDEPLSYDAARAHFHRSPRDHWAAYVAGCVLVLAREKQVKLSGGLNILIDSAVPEGKSVSSSAAIEVATMSAILPLLAHAEPSKAPAIPPRELAILCQIVENLVVGAPCGVMDQMTSACGRSGQLMALLCQPAELLESVPIPSDVAFWGIDSGVRHSIGGADYGSVRVGAFMGYRMIAELAGLAVTVHEGENRVSVDDPVWNGYLANIAPTQFHEGFAPQLPDRISGAAFLKRYGGTTDAVTRIDPARTYAVRVPTAHPIDENDRVQQFARLLAEKGNIDRLQSLGELMYASHASYSACGLGSEATDRLVELVRAAGPARGLFGAKITGGGSGGTVAVLGSMEAQPAIDTVVKAFAAQTGHRPYVFSGSGPGAAQFGTITLGAT